MIEVSFVLPCLNEEKTLKSVIETCHQAGKSFSSYEVIVADNGSEDRSVEIARSNDAIVINVDEKGYGIALKTGISKARGKYIVMGDSDNTYNFLDSIQMVNILIEGEYKLVMGNRFLGKIENNAMPFLHRYLGNPSLTTIGKILFSCAINDFHCGIRAFNKEAISSLGLKSQGMEFASEMVIRSSLAGYPMTEVPVTLRKDFPGRRPHLRTWRDGWRHLKFMFSLSPKYSYFPFSLFFLLLSISLLICNITSFVPFSGSNTLSLSALLYMSALWTSSEYVSSRILLSSKIDYRDSLFFELILKITNSKKIIDKLFQILFFLFGFTVFSILTLYIGSSTDIEILSSRSTQILFYFSMILSSTTLYLYLITTKINTYSFLYEKKTY